LFLCLGFALSVDGADGPLAREFKVAEVLPRWSGETLDLVVDFTTYVFVPAFAIVASGLMPDVLAIPSGVIVVITGAIYFADRRMKTDDNHFRASRRCGIWRPSISTSFSRRNGSALPASSRWRCSPSCR